MKRTCNPLSKSFYVSLSLVGALVAFGCDQGTEGSNANASDLQTHDTVPSASSPEYGRKNIANVTEFHYETGLTTTCTASVSGIPLNGWGAGCFDAVRGTVEYIQWTETARDDWTIFLVDNNNDTVTKVDLHRMTLEVHQDGAIIAKHKITRFAPLRGN